jgi:REP element-mobilizing transposase RayT
MSDRRANLPLFMVPTRRPRKKRPAPRQLELRPRTWGGRREGAGRPPTGRTKVAHRSRPRVTRTTPVHVTLRLRDDLPSLRRGRLYRIVRATLREVCDQDAFRICEYSVQGNHVHSICEADDEAALAAGMHALTIRLARRINQHLERRGPVFRERSRSYTSLAEQAPLVIYAEYGNRERIRGRRFGGRETRQAAHEACSSIRCSA